MMNVCNLILFHTGHVITICTCIMLVTTVCTFQELTTQFVYCIIIIIFSIVL